VLDERHGLAKQRETRKKKSRTGSRLASCLAELETAKKRFSAASAAAGDTVARVARRRTITPHHGGPGPSNSHTLIRLKPFPQQTKNASSAI